MKKSFKPGTMLNPVPVVMVTCGSNEPNIITVAWTGIVNSDPPMTYVSIRKSRHSHHLIEEDGEFVINLCDEKLTFATDLCGVKSGKDLDKFSEAGLTPIAADIVKCPMIEEAPVNLECKVREVHEYGSHDMFVAEIVNVHADEKIIDKSGRIRLDKAGLVCYNHGEYFGLKREPIGRFGYSVMKPSTRKRIYRERDSRNKGPNKKNRAD